MTKLKSYDVLNELEKNHNWSLFDEIYDRNKKGLERTALFYRGTKISYGEMLNKMKEWATSLQALGVKKGTEIPVCIANSPEFVYLLGGISILGAIIKPFGEEFAPDYITNIINDSNSDFLFVSDDKYEQIQEAIKDSNIKHVFMTSLTDSLLNNRDPYKEFDDSYYKFENKIEQYKQNEQELSINNVEEFLQYGKNHQLVPEKVTLTDILSVTFSSGSTNSLRPKQIVHKGGSYITMGRFHDPEVSGTPSMTNLRVLAQIPCHSNTNIMSCITDSLIQGSTVCLEPIYDKDFFMYSLLINKPNFPCATRSFWVNTAKQVDYFKKEFDINIKFPFLLAPMSVGEPLSPGEEKFCNKMLRKTKAGTELTHTPTSVVTMSVAGGDCEHGGIFFIMFRSLMRKFKSISQKDYDIMRTYSMVDLVVVDKEGNIVKDGQIGRLYATSPCNMYQYKNDTQATKDFFRIIDNKVYGDCSVYGYKDKTGYIHIKGRMQTFSNNIPCFQISETIQRDTKNILSCETVEIIQEDKPIYISHIEFQPSVKCGKKKQLLAEALKRCENEFGKEKVQNLLFRVRTNEESYPITGCGKRNTNLLREEGISNKTFRPIIKDNLSSSENITFEKGNLYIENLYSKTNNYQKVKSAI